MVKRASEEIRESACEQSTNEQHVCDGNGHGCNGHDHNDHDLHTCGNAAHSQQPHDEPRTLGDAPFDASRNTTSHKTSHTTRVDKQPEAPVDTQPEAHIDKQLDATSDGIDMDAAVTVLQRDTVYQGAVFTVEDMRIALPTTAGGRVAIRRQVLRHAPCVVMLVHDETNDRYLLEREYRVGSDLFAYGLPAGLMDEGEQVEEAALRELAEETGVTPASPDDVRFDHVGSFYSSEGMSDELAHIMVIHLRRWTNTPRHFDPDEHVESAWVSWDELQATYVSASNSVIAIQHEKIRRISE